MYGQDVLSGITNIFWNYTKNIFPHWNIYINMYIYILIRWNLTAQKYVSLSVFLKCPPEHTCVNTRSMCTAVPALIVAQWIHIDLGQHVKLLPDSTKPLPEPLSTYHQWGSVAFSWDQFCS